MEQKLIYSKMSAVMTDLKSVGKNRKNDAQGFKFRSIDDMINALYPALTKHGVFLTPELVEETHVIKEIPQANNRVSLEKHVHLKMKYHFYAEDGSSIVVGPIPSEGLDRGDKATNKALSAALKYALIQTFSIPTEDMVDADSDSPVIERAPLVGHVPLVGHETLAIPAITTNALVLGIHGVTNVQTTSKEEDVTSAPKSSFRKPKANGELWK